MFENWPVSRACSASELSLRRYIWANVDEGLARSAVRAPRDGRPPGDEAQVGRGLLGRWFDRAAQRARRVWGVIMVLAFQFFSVGVRVVPEHLTAGRRPPATVAGYRRAVAHQIAPWAPAPFLAPGADGSTSPTPATPSAATSPLPRSGRPRRPVRCSMSRWPTRSHARASTPTRQVR